MISLLINHHPDNGRAWREIFINRLSLLSVGRGPRRVWNFEAHQHSKYLVRRRARFFRIEEEQKPPRRGCCINIYTGKEGELRAHGRTCRGSLRVKWNANALTSHWGTVGEPSSLVSIVPFSHQRVRDNMTLKIHLPHPEHSPPSPIFTKISCLMKLHGEK